MSRRNYKFILSTSDCDKCRWPLTQIDGRLSTSVASPPLVTCFLTPLSNEPEQTVCHHECQWMDVNSVTPCVSANLTRLLNCTKTDKPNDGWPPMVWWSMSWFQCSFFLTQSLNFCWHLLSRYQPLHMHIANRIIKFISTSRLRKISLCWTLFGNSTGKTLYHSDTQGKPG